MIRTQTGPQILRSHIEDIFELDFSPDGSKLLFSFILGEIHIGDATNGAFRCLQSQNLSDEDQWTDLKDVPVAAVGFTPDGHRFLTVTEKSTLCVWDVASETRLNTFHFEEGVDNIVRWKQSCLAVVPDHHCMGYDRTHMSVTG